jgi:hypothetical protein
LHQGVFGPLVYVCFWRRGDEINEVNDRPVGKPQEKVLMNITASFPSVKKPRYVD